MVNVNDKAVEFIGTGRRKRAVARVRLRPGEGKIIVNGLDVKDYFASDSVRGDLVLPLLATNTLEKYDVYVIANGGGKVGQGGAIRHGLARALLTIDAGWREVLRGQGFLTRDPREKERKKPGQPGARRRFQFSKR